MLGDLLCKSFIKTIREVSKLDKLIFEWEGAFFAKHDAEQNDSLLTNDLTYSFILMVLTSPMDLRYENRFFYFQKSNDIIKLSLTQFADVDYSLFLKKWSLLFRTKIYFTNHDRDLEPEQVAEFDVIQSEYKNCLHNDILERDFPHVHLVLRYMSLSLKKSVKIMRFNDQGKEDVIVEDICFNQMRNLFLNIAVRLAMVKDERCVKVGVLMQEIIYRRIDRLLFVWDVNSEVYPNFLDDIIRE